MNSTVTATSTHGGGGEGVGVGRIRRGFAPVVPITEDPWAAASALARESDTYRFMVAFQPGFLHPVQAARMSASLQRATGGRLVYNIISGGGGAPQLWWGDTRSRTTTATRAPPSSSTCCAGVDGTPFDYDGRFFRTEGAALPPLLAGQRSRRCSSRGRPVRRSRRRARTRLLPVLARAVRGPARQVRRCPRAFAKLGRTPKFAVRIDVVARQTEEEAAWAEIEKGWAFVDREAANRAAQGDSVGAARIAGWVPENITGYRDLEVQPNVCAAQPHRGGPAFGLVGSYEQVASASTADRSRLDAFILAGNPHLEEAYRGRGGAAAVAPHHTHPGPQSFRPIGAVP
ncbi:LLM class flavin-dependent oxidoreductase [Rhodococcus hoagii]|nr:LLM class flavin-dependent oxidoreductase [Prescottella equi]